MVQYEDRMDYCLTLWVLTHYSFPQLDNEHLSSWFKTAATKWRCDHERVVREKCTQLSKLFHSKFDVQEFGLFLSTEYPFVGAFPDGLVTCLCCSDGIREIKVIYHVHTDILIPRIFHIQSPYCYKDYTLEYALEKLTFCLAETEEGYRLKHDHAYWFVCHLNVCTIAWHQLYYRCSVSYFTHNRHILWFCGLDWRGSHYWRDKYSNKSSRGQMCHMWLSLLFLFEYFLALFLYTCKLLEYTH